jgi:hypothetical protein
MASGSAIMAKSIIANLNHRFARWRRRYLSPPIARVKKPGTLKNIAENLGRAVRLAAWVIVLGLGAEIIVLLVYSADKTRLETTLLILCNVAIVIGVLGEDRFAHLAGDVALRQQEVSDEMVAKMLSGHMLRIAKAISEQIKRNADPRQIDPVEFKKYIEMAPPAKVEILYSKDGADCLWLAMTMMAALKGANWEIVKYGPIEQPTGDKAHLPPAIAAGGGVHGGVTLLGKPPLDFADFKKPFAALHGALICGGVGGDKALTTMNDDELPEGLFRIIVAPRP